MLKQRLDSLPDTEAWRSAIEWLILEHDYLTLGAWSKTFHAVWPHAVLIIGFVAAAATSRSHLKRRRADQAGDFGGAGGSRGLNKK